MVALLIMKRVPGITLDVISVFRYAAETLADLRVPPGNRLEGLRGDRAGQHSIRVNDQWRICFTWTPAGTANIEVTDYH